MSNDNMFWSAIILACFGYYLFDSVRSEKAAHDAQQAALPVEQREVSLMTVIENCRGWVTDQMRNPSTVDFQYFGSDVDKAPGSTTLRTTFTAKNDFNLQKTFSLICQVTWDGTVRGSIKEQR